MLGYLYYNMLTTFCASASSMACYASCNFTVDVVSLFVVSLTELLTYKDYDECSLLLTFIFASNRYRSFIAFRSYYNYYYNKQWSTKLGVNFQSWIPNRVSVSIYFTFLWFELLTNVWTGYIISPNRKPQRSSSDTTINDRAGNHTWPWRCVLSSSNSNTVSASKFK